MCDWLAGEVLTFDIDGSRQVEAQVTGLPFSIDWLRDGQLVITSPRGVVAGADSTPYGAAGQPFNEIVVDQAGRAWVDMPGSMPGEQRKPGIVAVVRPDGSTGQVADDVWFPNGMAIINETTLVAAESHADRLSAWTITDDAVLADRRVWAALDEGEAPDGICVDADGAIWYASTPAVTVSESPRVAVYSPRLTPTAAALRARSAVTTTIATVEDGETGAGRPWPTKWTPTLLELPSRVGAYPAGTIFLIGAVVVPGVEFELWRSFDHGLTWRYGGVIQQGTTAGGIWEPCLVMGPNNTLIVYYSDERDPAHSQKISEIVSGDGGQSWSPPTDVVAAADKALRPGMPIATRLPGGLARAAAKPPPSAPPARHRHARNRSARYRATHAARSARSVPPSPPTRSEPYAHTPRTEGTDPD